MIRRNYDSVNHNNEGAEAAAETSKAYHNISFKLAL